MASPPPRSLESARDALGGRGRAGDESCAQSSADTAGKLRGGGAGGEARGADGAGRAVGRCGRPLRGESGRGRSNQVKRRERLGRRIRKTQKPLGTFTWDPGRAQEGQVRI